MDDKQAELWQKAAIANRDRADAADAAYTYAERLYEAERARADRLAAALRDAQREAYAEYVGDAYKWDRMRVIIDAALADSPKEGT